MEKARNKDIGFLIMALFMLLLSLKSSQSLDDWNVYMQTNDANWYFGTGSETFFSDSSYAVGDVRDVLTGDMNGDSKFEVVVYDSTNDGWFIFNESLSFLGKITQPGTDLDFSESTSLYDVDGDSKMEIVVLGRNTTSSKGVFYVFNWDGGNTSSQWDKEALSNDGAIAPVCEVSYCYFVDYNNVVYKYSIGSKSIVDTLTIGGNGDSPRYLLKDDCSDHYTGDELLFIGDFDGDSIYGEYTVVDLTTLNNYDVYNYDYTEASWSPHMHPAIDCQTHDGKDYVLLTSTMPIYTQTRGYIYIDQILSNGTAVNTQKSYTTPGSSATQSRAVTNAVFKDTDLDGDYEACFGATGKTSSTIVDQTIKCYNLSNGVPTLSKTNTFTDASYPDFIYMGLYDGDFNDNGNPDFLMGHYYLENMATWTKLSGWTYGYVPSYAFIGAGSECLSLYTSTSTTTRVRFSEDLSCDYSGTPVTAGMPYSTGITYSDTSIDINTEDTINIEASATDSESDDIFWAYSCDYSGESDPIRTSEEYMDSGTNISELKTRFNINPSTCVTSFNNVYQVDGVIGYAWNITASDCLSVFYRNVTSGVGLSSNIVTTHFMIDSDNLLSPDYDGAFVGARDSLGVLMWGLHINYNESATNFNEIYRMDSLGDFYLLRVNNNQVDRILVDTNLDTQEYRMKIDEDLDGVIDFTSTWYSLLNPVHTTYHDTYFFTTANNVQPGMDFGDLSITIPNGDMWLDTLYVEYTDLPLFNVNASTTFDFDCIYTGIGTYEVRAWITDDNHPNNYSVYESQSILVVQGTTPPSVDCSGYSPPTCTGNCYFYDTFNHNYSISCIGWEGADTKYPYNQALRVEQTNMDGLSIYLPYTHTDSGEPIYTEEYDTFVIDFDFRVNDATFRTSFVVYDSTISNTLLYVYWEDENLYVIGSGGIENLFSYSEGALYNLEIIVDLRDHESTYVLQGDLDTAQTVSFYDTGIEDSGYYYFSPVDFNDGDMEVDNFQITYGDSNPEFDGQVDVEVDYIYNPDQFCGLNWTGDPKPYYIHSTCVDRGWADDSYRSFFCLPRACLQDVGFSIKDWFLNNLFMAIIVLLLFILIVPLIIHWNKNKN